MKTPQKHLDRHVHDYHETEEGSIRDSMEDGDIGDWDYDPEEEDPNTTRPFTVQ